MMCYSTVMDRERFARMRAELGYTQWELAHVLGVTQTTISRWESGAKSIGNPVILELAMMQLLDEKRARMTRLARRQRTGARDG